MSCCHIDIIASHKKVKAFRGDKFLIKNDSITFLPQDPDRSGVAVTKAGFQKLYLSRTQWGKIFDKCELWEQKKDRDIYILTKI